MFLRLISIIALCSIPTAALTDEAAADTEAEPFSSSLSQSQAEREEAGPSSWSSWNQVSNHVPDSHHYQSNYDSENVNNEIIAFLGHHYIETPSTTTKPQVPTPPPVPLPVVSRPLQVSLLAVIMTAAVLANGSVILNISRDSLKLRMVHFLLIRHVCITDCLGALVVLPVPLFAVAKGNWDFDDTMCSAVSTTTAACWTMHLLAVAFYRADRVLAVWLPTGRYPIFSVRTTNILLVIVWCLAVVGSYGATVVFGPTFQPALALCIPDVPLIFFVIVFAGYCIGLVGLTTGYVLAFARRRRRKRKKEKQSKTHRELQDNAPFEPTPSEYMDEEIGDLEDNISSSQGRKRRALSDQFPVLSMKIQNVNIGDDQGSPYAHRRTWSESATSYRPSTIFTSLVTKAHRHVGNEKSPCHVSSRNGTPAASPSLPESTIGREDSSSENLTITSTHGYQRLTEDEVSSSSPSEASTTVPKLVHSVSYDERGLYGSQPEELFLHRGGLAATQSKSFDCAHSEAQQRINFLRSHLLTSSVDRVCSNPGKPLPCSSTVHIPILDSSQIDIYSSDFLISPGQLSDPVRSQGGPSSSRDVSPDIPSHLHFPPLVVENQKVGNCSTYTNSTYPGPSHKGNFKEKSAEINRYFTGVYAWSLDRRRSILSRKNSVGVLELPSGDNPCFGESESSGSGSVSSLPNNDSDEVVEEKRPAHTVVHLDPNSLTAGGKHNLSLSVSVNSLSLCGDGRPPDVNSLTSRGVSENNNQIKPVARKHRTRARVKHFRAKGNKTGPAKRALASYAVSVGHLLLYLPAMFVVGLKGSSLPPGVALFCGIVVYCDFLIQPIALLLVSHRLRTEVEKTVRSLFGGKRKRKG